MTLQIKAQLSIFIHTVKNANFIFYNLKDLILLSNNYYMKSSTGLHFCCFLKCSIYAHRIHSSYCTACSHFRSYDQLCFFITVPEGINCTRYSFDRSTMETWLYATSLTGNLPSWPGFCLDICGKSFPTSSPYTLNVDIKLFSYGADSGQDGVMYNVRDMYNFDYVYFRWSFIWEYIYGTIFSDFCSWIDG